jgi:hypothetical protein
MHPKKFMFIALGAAALLFGAGRTSEAQIFGFGGNLTGLPYNYFQSQQELPFYAKFPPVYYSYPVARTYGWSPFAYPPGIMTPDPLGAAQPLEIVNPYAQPSKPAAELPAPSSDSRGTISPSGYANRRAKVILNPYVNPADATPLFSSIH